MTLSPMQLGHATRRQKQGWLLREIAAELDVAFEDVCLALYGDNDWRKADGALGSDDARLDAGLAAGMGRDQGDGGEAAGSAAGHGTPHPAFGPLLPQGEKGNAAASRMGEAAAAGAADSADAAPLGAGPAADREAEASAPVAAAGPAAEPVAASEPEGGAADAAPVVVDAAPVAAAPELAARPRAAAAALDADAFYVLAEFDGQKLHEHKRGLTRLEQFFWVGSAADVAKLKRQMPQWQDLEPVPTHLKPRERRW
jgi:hypothetical protein